MCEVGPVLRNSKGRLGEGWESIDNELSMIGEWWNKIEEMLANYCNGQLSKWLSTHDST